jgi:predicted metal-dependent peptidase
VIDAESRLAAARTRLILDKPFLGALAMRLPLVAAGPWCKTTASDARSLYYNPLWIAGLSNAQVQFVLAHEAMHCALGHFARRGHRLKPRWDLACDFAVNPLLVAEGLTPPAEAIVHDVYAGMAAEEIYPCLGDRVDDQTMDEHLWADQEGGQGGAPPLDQPQSPSASEREQLEQQWRRHLAGAAQRAREAGKLSGQMGRLVEAALAPQVSWRALLAQYLSRTAREDYSYQRPGRRGGGPGEPILPALRSHAGELVVALDVSGSINDADLAQFVGELNAIKGAQPVRITLLACDSALAPGSPWLFEPWQALELPRQFIGGGGTDFRPVFDWLRQSEARPDALIYFTDAEGSFPEIEPDYPVIWLVKGNRPVPWGQRLMLN